MANPPIKPGSENDRDLRKAARWCAVVCALSTLSLTMTIPFSSSQRDKHGCDALCVGSMTSVRSALGLVGGVLVGRLSDSKGRCVAIGLGLVAGLIGTLVFGLLDSMQGLWLSMLPSALFSHQFLVLKAVLSDFAEAAGATAAQRGEAMGVLGTAAGIGFMVGPASGGFLFADFQLCAAASAGLQALLLFGVLRFFPNPPAAVANPANLAAVAIPASAFSTPRKIVAIAGPEPDEDSVNMEQVEATTPATPLGSPPQVARSEALPEEPPAAPPSVHDAIAPASGPDSAAASPAPTCAPSAAAPAAGKVPLRALRKTFSRATGLSGALSGKGKPTHREAAANATRAPVLASAGGQPAGGDAPECGGVDTRAAECTEAVDEPCLLASTGVAPGPQVTAGPAAAGAATSEAAAAEAAVAAVPVAALTEPATEGLRGSVGDSSCVGSEEAASAASRSALGGFSQTVKAAVVQGWSLGCPGARLLLLLRLGLALCFHVFNTTFQASLRSRFDFTPQLYSAYLGFAGLSYALSQALLAKPLLKAFERDPRPLLVGLIASLACGRAQAATAGSVYGMFAGTGLVLLSLGVVNTAMSAAMSQVAASDQVGGLFGVAEAVESASGIVGPTLGGFLARIGPGLLGTASAAAAASAAASATSAVKKTAPSSSFEVSPPLPPFGLLENLPLLTVLGTYALLALLVAWRYDRDVTQPVRARRAQDPKESPQRAATIQPLDKKID